MIQARPQTYPEEVSQDVISRRQPFENGFVQRAFDIGPIR